ncbi:sirohydrochlorin chelatase [Streptacidiphilus anmyonensis]|uniref:sirohydrochlorin chelatase n=1 Tax=Streptacidiphilus anmyonensis TaxID=405782 RepID=UPI0007C6C068|nr:sirohydrochlorin chelatase [Streptacidiphilus anmyonensis]
MTVPARPSQPGRPGRAPLTSQPPPSIRLTSSIRLTRPTLLAVAHGTREPEGVATTEAVVARVRELRPELRVERCFLDLVTPSLPEALARLRGEVVLVPLLLGAGYHVRVDIPAALADAPHLRARVARALGPDPLLADALRDRLDEAGRRAQSPPTALVLAAAGSTDPAANADAAAMAGLLRARLPGAPPVVPAYLCAAGPTPAEAVAALRAEGHERVAVAAYLLGPGFFARRAAHSGARSGACLTSAPLGAHDALANLVTLRYDEAVADAPEIRRRGPLGGRTGAYSGRMLTPG